MNVEESFEQKYWELKFVKETTRTTKIVLIVCFNSDKFDSMDLCWHTVLYQSEQYWCQTQIQGCGNHNSGHLIRGL